MDFETINQKKKYPPDLLKEDPEVRLRIGPRGPVGLVTGAEYLFHDTYLELKRTFPAARASCFPYSEITAIEEKKGRNTLDLKISLEKNGAIKIKKLSREESLKIRELTGK